MSSRSQTKSLDRSIPKRKKKINYPQNVQKINNAAEHIICHYHNGIERIFDLFPIQQFNDELDADKIGDMCRGISIDYGDLSSVREMLKDSQHLLALYLDFVIDAQHLLHGINYKLVKVVTHGLMLYCVSLADYCTSEVPFVINYEKIIQKNGPDIVREVTDIEKQFTAFTIITLNPRLVMYHSRDVLSHVAQIRASINKLYYLITEWVDEERAYPNNLTVEMRRVKSQIFAIEQRTSASMEIIIQRKKKLSVIENQDVAMRKNYAILRRKHRDILQSQSHIETMVANVETQATVCHGAVTAVNRRLEHLRGKNGPVKSYHVSLEVNAAVSDRRDMWCQQYRLDDNMLALRRHKERLAKIEHDLTERMETVEKELLVHDSSKNRLLASIKEDTDTRTNDLARLEELRPIMDDLNFLYSKKNSPETLRQLRNHGRLTVESKELNLVDKMCDKVATKAPDSWRQLYLNLPFYPDRSNDQRSSDIEIIDLVSARNDHTPTKQARMCLNKWRLFYHNASPEHLIEGLKKSRLNDIAKEIEDLDAKSKRRYEED